MGILFKTFHKDQTHGLSTKLRKKNTDALWSVGKFLVSAINFNSLTFCFYAVGSINDHLMNFSNCVTAKFFAVNK